MDGDESISSLPALVPVSMPLYAWDGATWSEVPLSATPPSHLPRFGATMRAGDAAAILRIATLNILTCEFNSAVRLAIASDVRFKALVEEIERQDADILCLNEVDSVSYDLIQRSPFVRGRYAMTPFQPDPTRSLHGCVILTKVGVRTGAYIPQTHRSAIAVLVPCEGGVTLAVVSLHTVAYQNRKNAQERRNTITRVVSAARSLMAFSADGAASSRTHVCLLGDMNLHEDYEDGTVLAAGMLDLWAECHWRSAPFDAADERRFPPGYTFDPITNGMIGRYIPGEVRRMRLDRILVTRGAPVAVVEPVTIWADQQINKSGNLFLSDHYGLRVAIAPSEAPLDGSPEARAALEANAAKEGLLPAADRRGYVRFARFALAVPGHLVWLAGRWMNVV